MEEKIRKLKEAREKLQENMLIIAKAPIRNDRFYQYDAITTDIRSEITNEIRKLERTKIEKDNQIRMEGTY